MFTESKKIITDVDFDRRALYGKRFKILARWINIAVPKGKVTQKARDDLIVVSLKKLDKIIDESFTDISVLQEMSKITGIFFSTGCINHTDKQYMITQCMQELREKSAEDIIIDRHSMKVLHDTIDKMIPRDPLESKNKIVENNTDEYEWCAMGTSCKIKQFPAPKVIRCCKCKLAVHRGCGSGDSLDEFSCFLCKNLKRNIINPYSKRYKNQENNFNELTDRAILANGPNGQRIDLDAQRNVYDTPVRRNSSDVRQNTTDHHPSDTIFNSNMTAKQNMRSTRFDIRINIMPDTSRNQINNLREHISNIIGEMCKYDITIQLAPWLQNSARSTIDRSHIPETIQDINLYIPRIRNLSHGSTWGEFRLMHTEDWRTILEQMSPWLSDLGHGIYFKELQCERTYSLGWLLWSFRSIDTRVLSEEILKLHNIKISLRYSAISTNQGKDRGENTVKALHIWIAGDQEYAKTKEIIQDIYSTTSTSYPLEIKMRFVPNATRLSIARLNKIKKLQQRQAAFIATIEISSSRSWEIANLDSEIGTLPTLRAMLMEQRTKDTMSSLFLSVDNAYKRNDLVIFTYLPRYEQEARNFIMAMVPYMIYRFGNTRISEYFTNEACERAKEVEWDEQKQEIITKDDKYIDTLFNDLDEWETFAIEESSELNIEFNGKNRTEKIFLGEENDSIGTFQSKWNVALPKIKENGTSNAIRSQGYNLERDFNSSITIGSASSRKSKTDQSIEDLSISVQSLNTRIDTITTMQETIAKFMIEMQQSSRQANIMTYIPQNDNQTLSPPGLQTTRDITNVTETSEIDITPPYLLSTTPGDEIPGIRK
jgi:hypothetical protein